MSCIFLTSAQQKQKIGHAIQAATVLLIDETGKNLGQRSLQEALRMASERQMELVQVSEFAVPPVCRIMPPGSQLGIDRAREAAKEEYRRTGQRTKEIQFGHRIAEHDVQTKVRQMEQFLQKRCKVKATVVFRTWQDFDVGIAVQMLNNILERVQHIAKPSELKIAGRHVSSVFLPDPRGAQGLRLIPPAAPPPPPEAEAEEEELEEEEVEEEKLKEGEEAAEEEEDPFAGLEMTPEEEEEERRELERLEREIAAVSARTRA